MKVVFASLYFVARHGEAIAGMHLLRSLGKVATVTTVLSYDRPDAETLARYGLPASDSWRFPAPPWSLMLRRFGAAKRWFGNFVRFRG